MILSTRKKLDRAFDDYLQNSNDSWHKVAKDQLVNLAGPDAVARLDQAIAANVDMERRSSQR